MRLLLRIVRLIVLELLIRHAIETFEDVNQHRLFGLDVCLVGVADEVHIDLTITSLALLFNWSVEWIFLLKLVKVFIRHF